MSDQKADKIDTTPQDSTDKFHKFSLAFAPKLFEWLGWMLLIAGLQFLAFKSNQPALFILVLVCYTSLILYFHHFFLSIAMQRYGVTSHSKLSFASFLGALAISCTTIYLTQLSIDALVVANP